jgi:hypothetical protein
VTAVASRIFRIVAMPALVTARRRRRAGSVTSKTTAVFAGAKRAGKGNGKNVDGWEAGESRHGFGGIRSCRTVKLSGKRYRAGSYRRIFA